MALVFLSYDRDDAPRAKRIADVLKESGHKVWWDDLIKGGSQYSNEIEQALKGSDAVVVLWSQNSIQSAWVRDEAAAGRDRGCLVPVLLDQVEPPLGFRQFQNIDLSRWKGRGKPPQLVQLLNAIPRTGSERVAAVEDEKPVTQLPSRARFAWFALLAIALVAGAYFVFRYMDRPKSSAVPLVAVVAANDSAAAKDWARDVMVGLGGLEGVAARSFRLVDEGEQKADLVFEVVGAAPRQPPQASLVLRSAVDRSLLWSKEFKRPESKIADLQREVVSAAALILQCAQDGASGDQPLKPALLQDYIGVCWLTLGADAANLAEVTSTFLQITREAPEFERGWAGLLVAEAWVIGTSDGAKQSSLRRKLEEHIALARQVNPQLPEAYLAEAALLPANDVTGRIRLANQAVEQDPENANALMQRSFDLGSTGRMTAAIIDAREAARLQQFSPWMRDMYVFALQSAGQLDEAQKETEEAERLWPRADQLWFMRLRSHTTQGDPAVALALLESRKGVFYDKLAEDSHKSFLRARIDPSERNIQISIDSARAAMRRGPDHVLVLLRALAVFGRTDEILATMDQVRGQLGLYVRLREALFQPEFRDFWRDPRSMKVAQQLGVMQYWRSSDQWPDFCSDPDHPYDCKVEAEKLVR